MHFVETVVVVCLSFDMTFSIHSLLFQEKENLVSKPNETYISIEKLLSNSFARQVCRLSFLFCSFADVL